MNKIHIAFFWVGNDISIPTCLVKSIRLIYNHEASITQLTDEETLEVASIDCISRQKVSKDIMLARLEAYSSIKIDQDTIFLDADSLLISKINLPSFGKYKAFVVHRDEDPTYQYFNDQYPEYYPEFTNTKAIELMPLYFGFIAIPRGSNIFRVIKERLKNLPSRFHRWYGDQFALAQLYKENPNTFKCLNLNEYLFITKSSLQTKQLINLLNSNVKIITFKGKKSKVFIEETFNELRKYYENM